MSDRAFYSHESPVWFDIYANATLPDIRYHDYYTEALGNKSGNPIRQTDIATLAKSHLSFLEKYPLIYAFLKAGRYLTLIPLDDIVGNCYGFVVRGDAEINPASIPSKKPFMSVPFHPLFCYGFSEFRGFTYGKPIFVVEGIKDAAAIHQVHPYAIALLGKTVKRHLIDFLFALTNRIIYIADNDDPGKQAIRFARDQGLDTYTCPEKDMGIWWETPEKRENLGAFIRSILSLEGSSLR